MAVCKELRKRLPDAELFVWCDRKFGPSARTIVQGYDASVPVDFIISGKLRRYHGMSKWHLLHPSILLPNLVDMMKVAVGFVQSFVKLLRLRPDVVFVKGGYVCLPVGYAAHLLRIPLVIHDSDAHPGLTNRLLAPFAQKIGTGAPLEYYNYPKEKAQYVGIPISDEFHPYSTQDRHALKRELGFDETRPLTVITGGGLGAARLNEAVVRARSELLEHTSVFLISGKGQYEALRMQTDVADGWRLEPFISSGMAQVLAAADVTVVRAGATTLLELAALHKPTIIVPNGMLTAGHQLKNAKVYQDSFAAIVMKEEELQQDGALARKVTDLLRAPHMLRELGENFGRFAKPHAAKDMAQMIIDCLPKGRTT